VQVTGASKNKIAAVKQQVSAGFHDKPRPHGMVRYLECRRAVNRASVELEERVEKVRGAVPSLQAAVLLLPASDTVPYSLLMIVPLLVLLPTQFLLEHTQAVPEDSRIRAFVSEGKVNSLSDIARGFKQTPRSTLKAVVRRVMARRGWQRLRRQLADHSACWICMDLSVCVRAHRLSCCACASLLLPLGLVLLRGLCQLSCAGACSTCARTAHGRTTRS
jgi:hypothetical protein